MLDRRCCHLVAHDIGETLEAFGAVVTDSGNRCCGQPHAEQIGHQPREAFLRQQLAVQQVEHDGTDPLAILHRRRQPIRKARPCLRSARRTTTAVRPVFGNHQRPRFWQVKFLPRGMAGGHCRAQRCATLLASRRIMVDDRIRRLGPAQRLARMTLLASRFLARAFAQTAHPSRLFQPVTRCRLAAVAAVQPETALQLGDTGIQNRNLRRLRLDQRNQFVLRELVEAGGVHRLLRIGPPWSCQALPGQLHLRSGIRQVPIADSPLPARAR